MDIYASNNFSSLEGCWNKQHDIVFCSVHGCFSMASVSLWTCWMEVRALCVLVFCCSLRSHSCCVLTVPFKCAAGGMGDGHGGDVPGLC